MRNSEALQLWATPGRAATEITEIRIPADGTRLPTGLFATCVLIISLGTRQIVVSRHDARFSEHEDFPPPCLMRGNACYLFTEGCSGCRQLASAICLFADGRIARLRTPCMLLNGALVVIEHLHVEHLEMASVVCEHNVLTDLMSADNSLLTIFAWLRTTCLMLKGASVVCEHVGCEHLLVC